MSHSQLRNKLRSLPRPWKWLGGVVALYLIYAGASALLVPWIIRRQVVGRAREDLHREATLARVRFNPFTLKTTLIGFDLRDRDGSPLLAFDTMVVNVTLARVLSRALSLDEFRLVRPAATVRVATDGRLAIADLFEDTDTNTQPPASSGPPRFRSHTSPSRAVR